MKYLVDVKQANNGTYHAGFATLDEVRDFANAKAAEFKKHSSLPVVAFVMKNGDSIKNGRTFVM